MACEAITSSMALTNLVPCNALLSLALKGLSKQSLV